MKTKLHPAIALLFILLVFAAFIIIPFTAFYLMPKALVWFVNYLIHFVGWHIPFNVFTWAIAVYVIWLIGIARLVITPLKDAVREFSVKKK